MNSTFGKTFLFLTNLAWKSRVTLPVLITAGFMILNFRWEVEINIHTERIAIHQGMDDGRGGGGGGGGGGRAAVGVAAIDYSLEESWDTTDESDADDGDDDDEEDESDYEESDDDDDDGMYSDEDGANAEIRRIALVTF